jgi:Zinc-binding dehydrogenase
VDAVYFVIESRQEQLVELGRLVDCAALEPAPDSVCPLVAARAAFEGMAQHGKRGNVMIGVADDAAGA